MDDTTLNSSFQACPGFLCHHKKSGTRRQSKKLKASPDVTGQVKLARVSGVALPSRHGRTRPKAGLPVNSRACLNDHGQAASGFSRATYLRLFHFIGCRPIITFFTLTGATGAPTFIDPETGPCGEKRFFHRKRKNEMP
jgi:hypothetical protein